MWILTASAVGSNNDGFYATVEGVSYRSYWSNFHNRCIAPPASDPAVQQVAVR